MIASRAWTAAIVEQINLIRPKNEMITISYLPIDWDSKKSPRNGMLVLFSSYSINSCKEQHSTSKIKNFKSLTLESEMLDDLLFG